VPLLAIGCCLFLMFRLPWITWVWFAGWMGIGLLIYVTFGHHRSRLREAAN
jgi:APA family basic amino acid/polyamine antiporter